MKKWILSFIVKAFIKKLDKDGDGKVSVVEAEKAIDKLIEPILSDVLEKVNK